MDCSTAFFMFSTVLTFIISKQFRFIEKSPKNYCSDIALNTDALTNFYFEVIVDLFAN